MKLCFLGIGSAFRPDLGNTGAFFARGNEIFLLDCGEQAFARLYVSGILQKYTGRITIALTHLHADHCGSLGTLVLYAANVLGRTARIVHPEVENVHTLLSLMDAGEHQYEVVPLLDTPPLRMLPFPAQHAPAIPAYSYWLEDETERIYYSGDNAVLPQVVPEGLAAETVDHAYIDVNVFNAPPASPVHLPFATLCEQVPTSLRAKCTLMHVNEDFAVLATREGFSLAKIDPAFATKKEAEPC